LNKKNFKHLKTTLVFAVVIFLTITIAFPGCKKQEILPEEEVVAEEEEVVDTEESIEDKKDETKKTTELKITGNINILSGLEISDSVGSSRPIAVMTENSPQSRPQSGLNLADIVFEVVDEGGVTRYVAIYSSFDAEIMGPVRSSRPYYAEIARSFDPLYAFWGTYPEGYKIVEDLGLDDLSVLGDQSGNSSITAKASHWRDNNRSSPNNGYMSTLQLKEDAKRVGYSLEGGQSPLEFKIDAANSERGTISNITIDFSYDQYKVDFIYNKDKNNYSKLLAGAPHTDRETGEQITVNNVIVMITNIEGPIDESGHMAVRTTGTSDINKAFFFMDGNMIEGTWERTSVFDPFLYKDKDGNAMLFNRGSTWIAMVQGVDRLTY